MALRLPFSYGWLVRSSWMSILLPDMKRISRGGSSSLDKNLKLPGRPRSGYPSPRTSVFFESRCVNTANIESDLRSTMLDHLQGFAQTIDLDTDYGQCTYGSLERCVHSLQFLVHEFDPTGFERLARDFRGRASMGEADFSTVHAPFRIAFLIQVMMMSDMLRGGRHAIRGALRQAIRATLPKTVLQACEARLGKP